LSKGYKGVRREIKKKSKKQKEDGENHTKNLNCEVEGKVDFWVTTDSF
jgi:hypothetical protein